MSRKPQRRLAHAVPAVAIALALLPGAASANEDVPSSWAMGQTLYAYATGTAPAEGLTGCPLTTDSSQQCDLAEAIVLAKPGTTVALATPPTVADYVGNWAVGWDLSLARRAGPVTIEPAPGVTGPVLSGNYGHHDGCQTGTCRGPVLRVEGTATVRLFGIDINDAQDTTGLYGYSDQNAFGGAISDDGTGLLIISGCTFSRDIAGEPGGMNGEDIGNGGAIANVGVAPIIISRSTFAYDSAGLADGGAIYNDFGTVDITGSTFHGDRAGMGGAIKNTTSMNGLVNISSSTFSHDKARWGGGAVNNGGTGPDVVNISGSTFFDNSAGFGGALDNGNLGTDDIDATMNVSDSTFSGNVASDGATIDNGDNAIGDKGDALLDIWSSTFAGGYPGPAGDGGTDIDNSGLGGAGTVWAAADIFTGTCQQGVGSWHDSGYNVGAGSGCLDAGPGDVQYGASLPSLLGPLVDNGGPTETALPLPGDPAIGALPVTTAVLLDDEPTLLCPTTDQRGLLSPTGKKCDAGAVQLSGVRASQPPTTTAPISSNSTTSSTSSSTTPMSTGVTTTSTPSSPTSSRSTTSTTPRWPTTTTIV